MNKTITIAVLLFLFFTNLNAQEKLVKNNGDTLAIKLIELNEKYVVYNKTILADERVFTTPVSKLSKLIYADGTFIKLGPDNTIIVNDGNITSVKNSIYPTLYTKNGFWGLKIYSNEQNYSKYKLLLTYNEIGNIEAENLYLKGRNQATIGNLIGIPSSFILGWQFGNTLSGQKSNPRIYLASAVGTLLSMLINHTATNNIKNSVANYNESIKPRIISSENGIGLILDF